jgi:hypothetical protein
MRSGALGLVLICCLAACQLDKLLKTPDSGAPAIPNPGSGSAARITAAGGGGQADTVAATLPQPYVVRVADAGGNPVPGVTVNWVVTAGGGATAGAGSVTDGNGYASTIHRFGTSVGAQSVAASVAGVSRSPATFTSTATHGSPAALAFVGQPTNTAPGATIAPPVRVAVRDQFGNAATRFTTLVTISIAPGAGTPGARLAGTVSQGPVGGVATFGDLRIDLPGTAYRLRATVGGLSVDSTPFTILV